MEEKREKEKRKKEKLKEKLKGAIVKLKRNLEKN